MTDTPPIDVDALPPTQYLILEVLAARHRLGEALWTFPSGPAYRTAADQLAKRGIVGWKSGVAPKTIQVWFTDAGRAAMLDPTHTPPAQKRDRQRFARYLERAADDAIRRADDPSMAASHAVGLRMAATYCRDDATWAEAIAGARE